jgi:hypothetical protein
LYFVQFAYRDKKLSVSLVSCAASWVHHEALALYDMRFRPTQGVASDRA